MMAMAQYTTLSAALREVPDPRQRRGQRYPWWLLLTLIAAAVVSQQRHGRAIGQWVREHADEIRTSLSWPGATLPSEATLRRALRAVDLAELEACIAQFSQSLPSVSSTATTDTPVPYPTGMAVDGKAVRGVGAHGRRLQLVSLVRHDGIVLGQRAVADKSNEITAVPRLLADRDLTGWVVTMDAELTQHALARQIVRQHGDYLLVVKDNQPTLREAIATLFADPPWLVHERADEYRRHATLDKGHGRLETRVLEASPSLNAYLAWPGIGQVLRRTCRRVRLTTGEMSEEVTYGITSLPFDQVSPATLEALWRGHWTIENRVHYPRDVTFGEDAGQAWSGHTPHALAALRNGLLNLLRTTGWSNLADALRHYAVAPQRAFALIGATAM
jgi:predicted transposase YbfD/YdcC